MRHAISAHPTNYQDQKSNQVTSYKIDRNSLINLNKLSLRYENNDAKTFNIFKCISDYQLKAENLMDLIMQKVIKTRYKTSPKKQEEYIDKLKKIISN